MTKIFRPAPDNDYHSVLWKNPKDYNNRTGLSFVSMVEEWSPVEFYFYSAEGGSCKAPDISVITPGIVFRKDLKDLLFPVSDPLIEFLPILVSGADWILINCLTTISDYDEERSVLHRHASGFVYFVQKIVVSEASIKNKELFTVDGSNRAVTFVTEAFLKKINNAKLQGLAFRDIGEAN